MEIPLLKDSVIILVLAIGVVYLSPRLKLPVIVGLLLTGVLAGTMFRGIRAAGSHTSIKITQGDSDGYQENIDTVGGQGPQRIPTSNLPCRRTGNQDHGQSQQQRVEQELERATGKPTVVILPDRPPPDWARRECSRS